MLEAELYTGHLEVHQTRHSRISFFLFASTFLIFCMEQKSVQWSLKILDFFFFFFVRVNVSTMLFYLNNMKPYNSGLVI